MRWHLEKQWDFSHSCISNCDISVTIYPPTKHGAALLLYCSYGSFHIWLLHGSCFLVDLIFVEFIFQVDLLLSFCSEMGFSSVVLIGHDDGGLLALMAAQKVQASSNSFNVSMPFWFSYQILFKLVGWLYASLPFQEISLNQYLISNWACDLSPQIP